MVNYNTPLNRPVGHKSYDKADKVRAVLRIHLGYRSLINWARSAGMYYPSIQPQGPGSSFLQGNSTEGLQVEKRWAGSNKAAPAANPGVSKKIPGTVGVAYGVGNPTVPTFRGDQAKIEAAFGMYTPQWLYRLAENLKWSGSMSLSQLENMKEKEFRERGVYDQGKTKQLSGAEWKAALKADGKNILSDKKYKSGKRKEMTIAELESKYGDKGKAMRTVTNEDYYVEEDALPFGMRDMEEEVQETLELSANFFRQQQWENFPKFGSGGKNQHYTRTFSDLVYQHPSSLQMQMDNFKKAVMKRQSDIFDMIDFRRSLGPERPEPATLAPGEEGEAGQILVGGGQTSQEKMAEVMGIGHAPSEKQIIAGGTRRPDPESAPYGSKHIDVHLKKDVQTRNKLTYNRIDLTTDTYQSYKDHHGIGPKSGRTRTAFNKENLSQARKDILSEHGKMINRYNAVMTKLFQFYGTKNVHEVRRKIAREETTGAKRANLVVKLLGSSVRGLAGVSYAEMASILDWVLHAMGNFLSTNSSWASAMGIKLTDGTDTWLGTLIISYSMTTGGKFSKLSEKDIEIQEYSLEKWLYNLASPDYKSIVSLDQAMAEANEAFAVSGYVQQSIEAGIYRSAYNVGGAATAHLAMPIPGYFSETMDKITTEIISNISQGIEDDLQRDMITEATRFSRQMRTQLSGGSNMRNWMQGISDLFIGGAQVPRNPFWYLWTAPYLSSEYPQRGFGKQFQVSR